MRDVFVVYSGKDGDRYHRVGENGGAECGCLNPQSITVSDEHHGLICYEKGNDIRLSYLSEAKDAGYDACRTCFGSVPAEVRDE
jgi:hypothetical protein